MKQFKIYNLLVTVFLIGISLVLGSCGGEGGSTGYLPNNTSASDGSPVPTSIPASEESSGVIYGKILPPSDGGIYIGVYGEEDVVEDFEEITGKKAAIGSLHSFSDGGTDNSAPSFDTDGHEDNWKEGYATWTGIEPALGTSEPLFTPQDIIDGKIDDSLKKMAEDIKEWEKPVFWLYPRDPESRPAPGYDGGGYGVRGTLTKEEAVKKGQSTKEEYGDPEKLDGPERYIDMCRHIHDIMSPLAPNITWVMGPVDAQLTGFYTLFYPGDNYVDWHSLIVYGNISEDKSDFSDIIEPGWSEALSLADKPVMIAEFGIYAFSDIETLEDDNDRRDDERIDRSQWFENFFTEVKDYKELGAIIFYQMPESGYEIVSDDLCAEIWTDEMTGPNKSYWLSNVRADSGEVVEEEEPAEEEVSQEQTETGESQEEAEEPAESNGNNN